MRYTKTALLTFGAGLLLALAAVGAGIDGLQRVASAAMGLGIAALPLGMAVDWRIATKASPSPPARRPKARTRKTRPAARRHAPPRKPAGPNRR